MARFAQYRPDVRGTKDRSVSVRVARPEDAAAIAAVDATRQPRPEHHLDSVVARLARTDALTVVAEADGEVVGTSAVMVWAAHADSPEGWYVSGITVVPAWRRRLVADRMLALELKHLDRERHQAWSVVNLTNRASLALHERHGFTEVARAASFAGITFTGGMGVLLSRPAAS